MKSIKTDCTLETRPINWKTINWKQVERSVKSFQLRIAKATREGKHNKVKALQWMLTHSMAAKLLAVKRVTENSGKRTPGVDGVRWKPQPKNSGQPYLYPGKAIKQCRCVVCIFSKRTVRKDHWESLL